MRQHSAGIACCAFLIVSGASFSGSRPLENIPLKWSPTSTLAEMGSVDVSGAMLTTKIRVDAFVDTRQNSSLIAENREHADKVRQVTTSDDVAAFVQDHLKDSLSGAGLTTVESGGDLIVSGEIRKFFVTETDHYGGEISLLVHLKDSTGQERWSGIVSGGSSRFGRSYRADNYYETISDMTLRAAYNLLSNAGFREGFATR